MTRHKFAGKVRRDVERGVRGPLSHFALQLVQALHFADYAKALRVNKAIDQLAALDRAIFVQNKHRHMLHVVIKRIAKRDHLDQRRKKEEKESQRIAPDDDELLEQNCAKSSKWDVFHFTLFGWSSRAERGTSQSTQNARTNF